MDVSQGMMRALTQEQKDEVLKHDECEKESLFCLSHTCRIILGLVSG